MSSRALEREVCKNEDVVNDKVGNRDIIDVVASSGAERMRQRTRSQCQRWHQQCRRCRAGSRGGCCIEFVVKDEISNRDVVDVVTCARAEACNNEHVVNDKVGNRDVVASAGTGRMRQ